MRIEGSKQQWFIVLATVAGVLLAMCGWAPLAPLRMSPPVVLAFAGIVIVVALVYVWRQRRGKS